MKTSEIKLALSLLVVAGSLSLAAPARAQESAPPPPVEHTAAHSGRSSAGNGTGLGVGAAAFVSGLAGPQVVYDFGLWHLEGLLGYDRRDVGGGANPPSRSIVELGVSGWYHLHLGESSDFSLGGGLGFVNESVGGNSNTAFVLEPGAQVRAFVTPNVAIHGRLAVVLAFGDDTTPLTPHLGLDGNLMGGFGFTYFFR
jgi:hypothetical protein